MFKPFTTTVIGSYTVPDWYRTIQESVQAGKSPSWIFQDAKAVAVRAAVKDQEAAGVDLISDGELFRRDDNRFGPPNAMINYFAGKIPSFSGELRQKKNITPVDPEASFPAPVLTARLEPASLGLVEELLFLRQITERPVKIAMTGPHMFARIAWDEHYRDPKTLAIDMAAVINPELRRLDRLGCDVIQIDEPILWFRSEDQKWGIEAINACFEGVRHARRALHLCQGNYNPDPAAHVGLRIFPAEFEGVLPILQGVEVDAVLMAFASLGVQDLKVLENFPEEKVLGIGAIDVQTQRIEMPGEVVRIIERVTQFVDPERLWVNPDCGLNHLPRVTAFGKLRAMALGAEMAKRGFCAAEAYSGAPPEK